MGGGIDCFVDVQNLAVGTDKDRPAARNRSTLVGHAVGVRYAPRGIAKDGIVGSQLFRESGVLFDGVATGGEIGDFKFLEGGTAVTQRFTFLGSAAGKRLGIPGDDDRRTF